MSWGRGTIVSGKNTSWGILYCSSLATGFYLYVCVFVDWAGLYRDAQAGLQYLKDRRDIDRRKLIIFGRSLGGAVAVHLAASLSNRDR